MREVPSSIPGDITCLFQLLSFCTALTGLKWSIDEERGVKLAYRRPQVYHLLLLRVIDELWFLFSLET